MKDEIKKLEDAGDTDQVNLINKILQYAGMSIREIPLVQFAQGEEQVENTQQG